jgi:hypothetical protein
MQCLQSRLHSQVRSSTSSRQCSSIQALAPRLLRHACQLRPVRHLIVVASTQPDTEEARSPLDAPQVCMDAFSSSAGSSLILAGVGAESDDKTQRACAHACMSDACNALL